MPRRKRFATLPSTELDAILRDAERLRFSLAAGLAQLVPFNPQYEALRQIGQDLTKGLEAIGHVKVTSGPANHPGLSREEDR